MRPFGFRLVGPQIRSGSPALSDECPQTLNRLAAAARGAAGVALEAGTVADHGEVAAFGAAFAFIALHPGLCDLLGHPEE